MKALLRCATTLLLGVFGIMNLHAANVGEDAQAPGRNDAAAEKLGWELGMQAWTFHQDTLKDAIDKTAQLGLGYIEAFPGQKLGGGQAEDAVFIQGMPQAQMDIVKGWLNAASVKLVNYGVVGLDSNEENDRKIFDFAKAMGIQTIVSEPTFDSFDVVEKLADEYGINVALHNHPKPSPYWDPQIVLDQVKGRSKRLGACADTGHWIRSGIDPLEAIKLLEGRVISLHLKDLNEKSAEGHDVPWGSGVDNIPAILDELHRQGFKGVFSMEYEYNWGKAMPELAQCVEFFDAQTTRIADQAKQ